MADKENKEAAKPASDDKKAAKADKKAAKADKKAAKAEGKKAAKADKANKKAAKGDKKAGKDGKENPDAAADGKDAGDKKGKDGKGEKQEKVGFFKALKMRFDYMKNRKKIMKQQKEEMRAKVPFVDKPDKPERSSAFLHKAVSLDKKDNQFSDSKFQSVRKVSNQKEIIESFHRIGMDINDVEVDDIPKENLNKVCFVLINNYYKDYKCLGVGPLNDAYLFALIHHKMGFKIVFMFNPEMDNFTEKLEFFLANTVMALTIYYSGRDSSSRVRRVGHGIQFIDDEVMSSKEFGQLVGGKSNGTAKIIIISDCGSGKTVFSMKAATNTENAHTSPMINFSVDKKILTPRERRMSQGLFTYYFSKLVRQFPNASPKEMVDMLNISFERFKITFSSLVSFDTLDEKPMFPGADTAFNGTKSGKGKASANHQEGNAAQAPAQAQAPAAAPAASPA